MLFVGCDSAAEYPCGLDQSFTSMRLPQNHETDYSAIRLNRRGFVGAGASPQGAQSIRLRRGFGLRRSGVSLVLC